jgi:hypothetical protein
MGERSAPDVLVRHGGEISTYYQGRFWDFDYIGACTCNRPC